MSFFAVHALQDPTVKTLVGGDVSSLDAFFVASIRAAALGGKIYIATEAVDTTVIRGMAVWWGPGAEPFSTSIIARGTRVAQNYPQYRPDFAGMTERLLGPRGKLDSWYLSLLAVDPSHQRRGVARALIDAVRAEASAGVEPGEGNPEISIGERL
ncbi:hypothetical protein DFH09DRAFT_1067971 [Mycena vulgaris]|nr:hypothetical protein DFH09DRAFT_1067971 [Mycena vulgaris]